ncbi:hypothetical protein ACYZT3_06540 [Pseudomonas sp. MDT1-16]
MKRFTDWLGLGLCLSLAGPPAAAINQEIKASFAPDPSQPGKNVFINKTPNSGYCATYPEQCVQHSMFSIQLPVRFDSRRAIEPGESIALKVPANWRQLTVTNSETHETETVEVRIIGIGSMFILSESVTTLTGEPVITKAHDKLWTSNGWVYPPSPCQYSGVASYAPRSYRFFWKAPVEAPCTKVAAFTIPSIYFNTFDFAYELRTPNPLGMSSGVFTGSFSYSIGTGADFDFGPLMQPNDNILTLDFVLDVQHVLKVDIPPGGDKVLLVPAGGWQSWLQAGRKPVRLFRDQTFTLSASSRFKMYLECSSILGTGCSVSDADSLIFAPLKVSVTMPHGVTDVYGKPVEHRELSTVASPVMLQASQFVERKPGKLHFELEAFDPIFSPTAPKRYSGSVVVVWDSEV